MNALDIFKKLTRGVNIKFDKRFEKDRVKLGQVKANVGPPDISKSIGNYKNIAGNQNYSGELNNENSELADISLDHEESDNEEEVILDSCEELATNKKPKKEKTKEILAQLKKEEINRVRKLNRIHIWGTDINEPIQSFEKLKEDYEVNEHLIDNLRKQGFTSPTPIQMQAWSLMLNGRELLACAPTGSGKTAAFLVPIIHRLKRPRKKGFRAVIVAPTRELARQTYRECERLTTGIGLRTAFITNVNKARIKYGPNSSKKIDILVTTPNRLACLLLDAKTGIDLKNVEFLIIDESDRLFESGVKGFRDQIAQIYQACSSPSVIRAMFSATFAPEVENWAKLTLNNVAMVTVGMRNTACSDVKQEVLFCGNECGKMIALRDIFRKGYEPPVLIFVQTKDRANQLFKELLFDNLMVEVIHGDRTELQRDNIVKAFRDRKIWVLICTELMGRGIDFKGVNMVINYDFPPSTISYVHRVGRTGRAGHQGSAVTFWTMDDEPLLRSVARIIKDSGSDVPAWMLEMSKASSRKKKIYAKNTPNQGVVSEAVKHEELLKAKLEKQKQKKALKKQRRKNRLAKPSVKQISKTKIKNVKLSVKNSKKKSS